MKDLGHFFRILSLLWVSEEFVNDFTSYLDQLLPTLNQLFGIDSAQLQQMPNGKIEVMKLFHILRGVVRGLVNSRTFKSFFDWFYPQYLSPVIEGALNAFH